MIKELLTRFTKVRGFSFLVITGVLLGVLESATIFTLGPFLSYSLNIEEFSKFISSINLPSYISSYDELELIFLFGIFTLLVLLFSNINSLIHTWLVAKCSYNFGNNLIQEYLIKFLNSKNSNDQSFNREEAIKNINVEITRCVEWVIQPLIGSTFRVVSLLLITIGLFIYNFAIASILIISILIVYLFIYFFLKDWLTNVGDETSSIISLKQLHSSEIITSKGILRLFEKEDMYLLKLRNIINKEASLKSYSTLASNSPKMFLETIAFSSLIIIILFLIKSSQGSLDSKFITSFSIIAISIYKLLPAAQAVYYGISRAKFNFNSLRQQIEAINHLDQIQKFKLDNGYNASNLSLRYPYIEANNLSYSIGDSHNIINNLSFSNDDVPFVGFVGPSGGGKSTLLKILSGIEDPVTGKIFIEQMKMSYLPQDLLIFRGSLLENITLFEDNPNIKLLKEVWKVACIDFCSIENSDSFSISDSAKNISGGQLQRINIARSLYALPKIIFLDEFTSQLDPSIEEKLIINLRKFAQKYKTKVVMSAHRELPKKYCDKVYTVSKGEILSHHDQKVDL